MYRNEVDIHYWILSFTFDNIKKKIFMRFLFF